VTFGNDPPGTRVTFGVRRGGGSRMVTLTLRDLI
jgi:S1-C subfamily serine protease